MYAMDSTVPLSHAVNPYVIIQYDGLLSRLDLLEYSNPPVGITYE